MGYIKKNIYIILLFILVCSVLPGADELILKSWKTPDGLPRDSIQAIAQGKDGYIWIGTNNGLARFDGVRFKVFTHWNTPPLTSDKIASLLVDRHGKLWIGLDGGGVAGYLNGEWSTVSIAEGLSHSSVTSLFEDRAGNLWIGTNYGVNRLASGVLQNFTTDDGLPGNIVQAIGETPGGNVLVGTLASGLAEFSNGGFSVPEHLQEFADHAITVIRRHDKEATWIGSDQGLFLLRDRQVQLVGGALNPIFSVRSLALSSAGSLWVGTDGNGAFEVSMPSLQVAPVVTELSEHFVYSLLKGREGEFWLGTFTEGLFRLTEKKLDNWLDHNPARDRLLNTVLVDSDNLCWVGTQKGGLLKLAEGKVIQRFNDKSIIEDDDVRALWEEENGVVWVGTASGGVFRIEDDDIESLPGSESNHLQAPVNVFYKDRNNLLWIGTGQGIARIENRRLVEKRWLSRLDVRVLVEDGAGALWAGTDRGLHLFKNGGFEPAEIDAALQTADIISVYADKKGTLWIGTNGAGLFVSSPQSVGHITTANGLGDDFIYSIQEDGAGRFWFSSGNGIFMIPAADLVSVSNGESATVRCHCLDEEDGMASRQCNGGAMPSSWQTAAGNIYYPTNRGVAILKPSRVAINNNPPDVKIEQVLADNRLVNPNTSIQLQENTRVMEFYFTALSFSDPAGIRFKYKLEGFDEDWNTLSPQQARAAMYINLEPGDYRFRVLAANSDGVWNEEGAGVSFRIGAGFPWIPVALAIIALAAGILFVVLRKPAAAKDPGASQKKYSTSALTEDRAQTIQKRLLDLMEGDRLYLDPDLTLKRLSEKLQVHPNYLSQIINESLKQSSSDFINGYRIQHVKEKLLEEKEAHKTILDIALESGFYSKSVFNTAFKKFTGTTPSKFRKK
jgi:ligand-binding sensor domain-containing protein/AraC-like DNA-binding protein